MNPQARLVVLYVVRFIFMLFAGWIAFVPDALPSAHPATRAGLAALVLVFTLVLGWLGQLATKFDMLLRAIKTATTKEGRAEVQGDAVGILIRALGSREPDTREKAHLNLMRITGQDLPPDKKAWQAWWDEQRRQAAERQEEGPLA